MHPKTDVNSFGHTSNNCEIYQCSVVHVQNIQAKALIHPQGGRKQWHSEHIPVSRKNSEQNKYTCTKCPTSTRFNNTISIAKFNKCQIRSFWTTWTCFSCFFFAFSGVTYQTERWTNFTKKGHQRRAAMLNRWIKLGISLTELVIAARGIN